MKKYLPNNQIITPKIHPDVAYFIDHFTSVIIEKTTDSLGVLHVVFPHVVTERIETMQKYFAENNTNVQIYAAHKPTRSTALMRALYKKGVGASYAFVDDGLHFAVAETRKGFIAQRSVIEISNLFGQLLGGGTGK